MNAVKSDAKGKLKLKCETLTMSDVVTDQYMKWKMKTGKPWISHQLSSQLKVTNSTLPTKEETKVRILNRTVMIFVKQTEPRNIACAD